MSVFSVAVDRFHPINPAFSLFRCPLPVLRFFELETVDQLSIDLICLSVIFTRAWLFPSIL